MENLPKENQPVVSKFKFFLLLGLGLVILVLVGEGVYWWKLKEKKKRPELTISTRSLSTLSKAELPAGLILSSPVEKEHLEKALLDKKYFQALSFFLPAQEPIKAIFGGRITKVLHDQKPFPNDLAFEEICLERKDKEFWASYIIVGEVLVQEGQEIVEGELLAKAKEEGLKSRSGINFSFWLHDKDNQTVRLSKEMFKATKY